MTTLPGMRRLVGLATAALAVACTIAACSGSTKTVAGPTVTRTTTITVSATPSSSSSSSSSGSRELRLGQTYHGNNTGDPFTATVYAYKKSAAPDAPPPGGGQRWDGARVKVCITATNAEISSGPWSLLGSDSGLYQPSSDIYDQFPSPQYPPGDQPVSPGQCVQGWIIFPVPPSTRVVTVQYSLDTGDSTIVVHWRV